MEYVTLNNGVKMPLVGLGTWNLRGQECTNTVKQAIELGYRLIDTAQMYDNENAVGKGIMESGISREDVFVTTKLYRISNSYEKAQMAIDTSLINLGLDYIDLLLLHEPYVQGTMMYRALEEAYAQGKVRAIGISNSDEQHYSEFIKTCQVLPAINQVEAHVYYQKSEFQKLMEHKGTHMQAWAPLAQGIRPVAQHPDLVLIGQRYGKTTAQVALRFLVQRGISIIPKSKHETRLKENLDIFDFILSTDEMQIIQRLDQNETLFPWTKEF